MQSLRRSGRDHDGIVGAGLHVLMSAAMLSMLWTWGATVPVIAQVTVFTGAAAWFAGRALFGRALTLNLHRTSPDGSRWATSAAVAPLPGVWKITLNISLDQSTAYTTSASYQVW